MKHLPLWQRLTTGHLLALLPVGLLFALALGPIEDPDFWWHLKAGNWILAHHAIPRVGLWSWIGETRPWMAHEWLFEVGAAGLYHLAGLRGPMVATAALVAGAFAIVLCHARRASGSAGIAAGLTLLAGIASWPFWSERPQVITYVLVAYWLLSLERWRSGGRRHLWGFAPLVMLWANLHGAYVLAFALMGAYGAAEVWEQQLGAWRRGEPAAWGRARHLALVAGACAGCALLNPHGLAVFAYPVRYMGAGPLTRFVEEWFSPNFGDPRLYPFGLFLLGTIATMAASPVRPRLVDLLLLLLFTAMALFSQRNLPLMLVVVTPILARHLRSPGGERGDAGSTEGAGGSELVSGPRPPRRLCADARPDAAPESGARQVPALNWVVAGLLVAMVASRFPWSGDWSASVRTNLYPERAVAYLERHPPDGRMLNYYGWGGYLIWKRAPRHKVFIDGRADIYGDEVLLDYVAAHRVQPGWRQVLEKYRIDWVLWRTDAPLAQVLRASGDWREAYHDDLAVIFVRR